MVDFATLRRNMVNGQIRTNNVTDAALISALLAVPREQFVPAPRRELAYVDADVPLGAGGRALVQPLVLAQLIQAAGVRPTDKVLDIGCGSGYAAAILSRLAGSVVAVEEDAGLAAQAETGLATLGAGNVTVVRGPLADGCPNFSPYDVILIEGAVQVVPPGLRSQLSEGGRLLAVVGSGRSGKATIFGVGSDGGAARELFDAAIPLLPGFTRARSFQF